MLLLVLERDWAILLISWGGISHILKAYEELIIQDRQVGNIDMNERGPLRHHSWILFKVKAMENRV